MLKEELIRGRVSFGAHEEYRVLLEDGAEMAALPSGVLRAYGELPAAGDWVWVRPAAELCLIETVEKRTTAFIRRAAGRERSPQCVAANIDVCFVVCGLDADFNLRRIERYLVLAWESGAQPVVVLNKADICVDVEAALVAVRSVAGRVDVVSIAARLSAEPLRTWLRPGLTAALLGSSGAGKSTIANALTGKTLATREVREYDSRGRHTTTARMLMALPGGAWLIDTPGMRELGLLAGETSLDLAFPEIAALAEQCRFADCAHDNEPGCAVRTAVEQGRISPVRWASYAKLQREARHHAMEADASAQRAVKQKWKAIHKAQKRMYRERGH
ncbi:MAG: ribosome small subunit-dependent GTPase A [Bryobacterales bacterium]|nr:ribosome small subunit-dependent GTPase A [Bryobacterales bacterium]MBV9401454.1 ribosome small subunit-dependent GTPase A [Bryobacterales bacterium]